MVGCLEMKEMRKTQDEEEDEPLFMNDSKGYIQFTMKYSHKITRKKDHKSSPSFFSYLPASLKYIFMAIMALGVVLVAYVMIFTNKSATKFQNKGKLLTYLENELKTVNHH